MAARGRKTIAQRIALDGGDEIRKEFAALGDAGEKAFKQLKGAIERQANLSPLERSLKSLKAQFTDIVAAGGRVLQSFGTLGTAVTSFDRALGTVIKNVALFKVGVTLAAGAIGLLAKNAANNAEHITGQAEALGISAQAYQNFQTAVTSAGLAQDTFDQILSKFAVTAADGTAGAGELAKAFRQVEITGADGAKRMITVHGTSDSLAKSLVDTTKAFRQLEITAEDGTKKFITIMGTSDKLAKSVAGLVGGGEQGLVTFAKNIEALKTSQERLNAVSEAGFAKKVAPQVVRAMLAIARDADPAARAINKLLEPLSNIELGSLLQLDSAFDRLGTNISRIKDRLVAAFGAPLSNLLNGLADAIFANQAVIVSWAQTITTKALVVVKDLFALLRGDDAAVQNKGLIAFRDAVVAIGVTVKTIFLSVVVPAFLAVVAVADKVAAAINLLFGTHLSGIGLVATAAILQVVGGFKLLIATTGVALAAARVLKDVLLFVGVRASLAGIINIIARISTLLTGLLVANPILGAILLIAGGLAIVATRQSDAQVAAQKHREALDELKAAVAAVAAGVPGAAADLDRLSRAHIAAAQAAIKDAQAQVAAARAALAALPGAGENQGKGQFLARIDEAKKLDAALAAVGRRKQDLDELQAVINSTGQTIPTATAATSNLASELQKASTATNALEANVRKVDPAFTEAAIAARKLQQQLATAPVTAPQNSASLLAPWQALATGTQQIFAGIEQAAQTLITNVQQIFSTGAQELVATLQTVDLTTAISGLTAAFDGAISAILSAWSGMISSMASELQSLTGAAAGLQQLTTLLVRPFTDAQARIAAAIRTLVASVSSGFNEIVAAVQSAASRVEAAAARIEAAMRRASSAAKSSSASSSFAPSSFAPSSFAPSSFVPAGLAGGGPVRGPGSTTSDSILARLSNREYVVNARAVDFYGPSIFDLINAMRLPREFFRGFRLGGLVDGLSRAMSRMSPVPAFAGGGLVERGPSGSSLQPFSLTINGTTFKGLQAPQDEAQKIIRFALNEEITSAGAAPGWVR